MLNRINICNIPVDNLTMQETVNLIGNAISEHRSIHHVAINAVKVVNAQNNASLKASIIGCDIINADGKAIVWASRILNKPLPERIAGIDLMEELVIMAAKKNYHIFLLGAKEEIVTKVVEVYTNKYGKELIAGYRNGYFKKEEENQIAEQIANSKAEILFVAMTSPNKEIFLNTYKNIIQTPFIMGVGGSFDVVSGFVKRAPKWMQNWGLEWLFRTIQEPRRLWKRYLIGISSFAFLVLKEKVKQIFS